MASTSGLVTILFTDVVGSTEINSAIGDMAADELRRLHFDDLNEAIELTGGTLVKTIGDAVMASYSSAADALHGAVEMQRAVDRRNRRASGQDLHIRIGVSAGDATFENDDWFGTPVVEASRLCSAAETDQILISDLVTALAGSRIDYAVNALGTRDLKGLPQAINVADVAWRTVEDTTRVPLPGFVDTNPSFAFAGRAGELEVIQLAWKDAIEQRRRVVLMSGEPGVGKTRLVTEFVRTAHDDGGVVLWGRCDEVLDVPYQPFAEALRLYIGSISDDQLRSELGPLVGELSLIVPDLTRRLPGVTIAPVGDADAERHRLFEAVSDAFASIARNDPVVLVLDDIHWADKPSLLLLRHLLRRSEPIALLVLGTYRDTDLDRSHPLSDVLADLRRENGVERVDISGLDIGELTRFMELAAGHELDEAGLELAHAVHRETEGNPFFLSEMIRHLVESGYLVHRDGRWVSDYTLAEVGIPEGIREVVGRRLSTLSMSANAALSIASVIGPEFDASTIEAADGPTGDELFDALDSAVRASVIREVAGSYGRYAFAHALVRSTLYEELSTNKRVRLHWRVATALAARHADNPDYVEQLAHHYTEGAMAGDPALAVHYCLRAAHDAVADLAFEAATRSFDRALSAFDLLASPDPEQRIDIEIERIESMRDSGSVDFHDAGIATARAAKQIGDAVRFARSLLATSWVLAAGTVDHELVQLVRDAIDGLGSDRPDLRAQLQCMLVVELYWGQGTDERVAVAREALDTARGLGDPMVLSHVLSHSWALFDATTPYVEEWNTLNDEAIELAEPGTTARLQALANRIPGYAVVGETDAALALADVYVREVTEVKLSRSIWAAMNTSAMLAIHVGDIERAEAEAASAFDYAHHHGLADRAMGPYGGVLYNVRRAQGRAGELIQLLEGLVESQPGLPVWRVALAGAAHFSQQWDIVRQQFEWLTADDCSRIPHDVEYPVTLCALARLAPAVDADSLMCELLYDRLAPFAGLMNFTGASIGDANDLGLACVADQLGRFDDADRHYQDAIDLASRGRALPYELHYRYEWAKALHRRGDSEAARPLLETVAMKSTGRGMDGPDGYVTRSAELLALLP